MRLLLVEDDTALNRTISELLKKEGFITDSCEDGESGYWHAKQNIYDLILLDRMLPERDGIGITKALREEHIYTPILLLTALGEVHDKVEGLDAGADDYLTKPFSIDELLARIRSLSRRPRNLFQSPNLLKAGDLEYDARKNFLSGPEGVGFSLSKREGHLMELFLSNPAQILTRGFLLGKVWGLEGGVEDGNLDNYIHFLRRRLQSVKSRVQIKTVRGTGYRLDVPNV